MVVVTTYVCDVSGKSGTEARDFVTVNIKAHNNKTYQKVDINKIVHIEVAKRLNLTPPEKNEPAPPEVSLEGKLKALLVEYVDSIVADAVHDHLANSR